MCHISLSTSPLCLFSCPCTPVSHLLITPCVFKSVFPPPALCWGFILGPLRSCGFSSYQYLFLLPAFLFITFSDYWTGFSAFIKLLVVDLPAPLFSFGSCFWKPDMYKLKKRSIPAVRDQTSNCKFCHVLCCFSVLYFAGQLVKSGVRMLLVWLLPVWGDVGLMVQYWQSRETLLDFRKRDFKKMWPKLWLAPRSNLYGISITKT